MVDKIVIVIPTYGRNTLLKRTLESLSKCDLPKAYVKTIVIENGPKANAETICAKFPRLNCEYQYTPVANKSSALNSAVQTLIENAFVIFLDDDVRVSKDLISSYNTSFERFDKEFIYGGPMGVDYEVTPPPYYRDLLPVSAKGWELNEDQVLLVRHLMGCNWAVHKSKIDLVGGFDERFGPNSTTGATGQEHDMMVRLNEAGVEPVYVPEALVWHYVPAERASLRWALIRKFKMGVSYGLSEKQLPYKDLSSEIGKSMFSLTKAVIKMNRTQAVQRLFNLYFLLGVRRGLRIK